MYEAKLPINSRVRLFGLPPAHSSYERATGVIMAFNRTHNRYVVTLDDERGTWRLNPNHLVKEDATLSELITEAHGFTGIAREEVQLLSRIHGESRVIDLVDALIKLPVKEHTKNDAKTQWTVAADLQLVVSFALFAAISHSPSHMRLRACIRFS